VPLATLLPGEGPSDTGAMQALESMITEERQKLQRERSELLERRGELGAMHARELELIGDRASMRRAKLIGRQRERLERQIRIAEAGTHLERFEERVIPFMRAQGASMATDDAPVVTRVPGGAKRRRTGALGEWTEQTIACDGTVVRAFMTEFRGAPAQLDVTKSDICSQCGGRMLLIERKSVSCCEDCGASCPHIDMTSVIHVQKGDVEFVSQTYKRSNHFLEWLNQCQAKESTVVTDDVLVRVMGALYDRGLRTNNEVTVEVVRSVLKALRMRSQYEHVCQITCKLNGEPPPRFLPVVEERLRLMFLAVQAPFENAKGKRKNFLSYAYTLSQFLQLLGIDVARIRNLGFAQLKGKDKLDKQNVIYEKICRQLAWEFQPIVTQ